MKNVLKTEGFAFFDNSRFMTTENCKARNTAQVLHKLNSLIRA